MGDTILTWKFTNFITIGVMGALFFLALVLLSQGVHLIAGNTSNG